MSTVTLVPATFRALFPEFGANPPYTDAVLQTVWDNEATLYVTPENCGSLVDGARAYAIQLMTAHLLRLSKVMAAGAAGGAPLSGVVVGSTIDKVTVTLAPPPTPSGFRYWLSTTPYGLQLVAYLTAKAVGGFYAGGLPERSAFRKVGGVW